MGILSSIANNTRSACSRYTPGHLMLSYVVIWKLSHFGTESECRPRYQALSHVWGDGKLVSHITINDRPVRITKNLEEALWALRDAPCPIILWADQLCVNQDNYEECTHQVKLMKDIYKSAIEVLIWLGNSEAESRIAFKFISEHAKIWWCDNQLYMKEAK